MSDEDMIDKYIENAKNAEKPVKKKLGQS